MATILTSNPPVLPSKFSEQDGEIETSTNLNQSDSHSAFETDIPHHSHVLSEHGFLYTSQQFSGDSNNSAFFDLSLGADNASNINSSLMAAVSSYQQTTDECKIYQMPSLHLKFVAGNGISQIGLGRNFQSRDSVDFQNTVISDNQHDGIHSNRMSPLAQLDLFMYSNQPETSKADDSSLAVIASQAYKRKQPCANSISYSYWPHRPENTQEWDGAVTHAHQAGFANTDCEYMQYSITPTSTTTRTTTSSEHNQKKQRDFMATALQIYPNFADTFNHCDQRDKKADGIAYGCRDLSLRSRHRLVMQRFVQPQRADFNDDESYNDALERWKAYRLKNNASVSFTFITSMYYSQPGDLGVSFFTILTKCVFIIEQNATLRS